MRLRIPSRTLALCLIAPLLVLFILASSSSSWENTHVNNNTTSGNSGNENVDKAKEFEERRALVRRVCSTMKDRHSLLEEDPSSSYMLDKKHGLLYCRHAKVGTSTWLEIFLQLSTMPEYVKQTLGTNNRILHEQVPEQFNLTQFGIETVQDLNTLLQAEKDIASFTFVRHPFDRLVSAFEDKMLLQRDKTFRNLSSQLHGNFSAFINHVLSEFDSCKDLNYCNEVDPHWRRFNDRCAFCDIDFAYVGKMETFEEDVSFLLESRGLKVKELLLRKNGRRKKEKSTKDYFEQLSPEVRMRLRDVYELDFRMFGYDDWSPYL